MYMKASSIQVNKEGKHTVLTFITMCTKIIHKNYTQQPGQKNNFKSCKKKKKPSKDAESFLGRLI